MWHVVWCNSLHGLPRRHSQSEPALVIEQPRRYLPRSEPLKLRMGGQWAWARRGGAPGRQLVPGFPVRLGALDGVHVKEPLQRVLPDGTPRPVRLCCAPPNPGRVMTVPLLSSPFRTHVSLRWHNVRA